MEPSAATTHATYFTAIPSLLSTLSPENQLFLERACEARQCGRYSEARQIFDERFPHRNRIPLLVFEYADLLANQGMEGERASFLQESVAHLSLAAGSDEQMLFDLMLADAKMWAFGSLGNALKTARESLTWLNIEPNEPISDLHVRGFQLYHRVMERGRRDSNWVKASELAVLSSSEGDLLVENANLAERTMKQGDLTSAAKFNVDEMNTADEASNLEKRCDEFAVFCDELEASDSPPLIFQAAYLRLTLASRCPGSRKDLAQACRRTVVGQLQRLAGLQRPPSAWEVYAPKILAKLQIGGFDATLLEHVPRSPDQLSNIADQALSHKDATTAVEALQASIVLLRKDADEHPDQQSVRRLWDTWCRVQELHRNTTRSLRMEGHALIKLLWLADLREMVHAFTLSEVDRFLDGAREFDVPSLLERLYDFARMAADASGRRNLLLRYDQLHADAVEEMIPKPGEAPYDTKAVISRLKFNTVGLVGWARNAVEIALMWVVDEVEIGETSEAEWSAIFGFYDPRRRPQSASFLDLVARVRVERRNFSKVYVNASREEWTSRLRQLHGWLSKEDRRRTPALRTIVLRTIAEGWVFQQREHWQLSGHTPEENAPFLRCMTAIEDLSRQLWESLDVAQPPDAGAIPSSYTAREKNAKDLLLQLGTDDSKAVTAAMLDDAINDSSEVAIEYEKRQNHFGTFVNFKRRGELLSYKYKRGPPLDVTSLNEALPNLLRAIQVFDEVRRRLSIPLAQHQSLAAKMQKLSEYDAAQIYALGNFWSHIVMRKKNILLVQKLQQPIPSMDDNIARQQREREIQELYVEFMSAYESFQTWIQRFKGRALLDLLSVDTPISPALLDGVSNDIAAVRMVEEEQSLVQRLSESSFPENTRLQEHLDEKRAQMRSHPSLEEIMRIRDGDTITPSQILELLGELPDHVIVVDFNYIDFDKGLRAVCYRKGLTYFTTLIPGSPMEEIMKWTKHIERPDAAPLGSVEDGKVALSSLTQVLLPLFKVVVGVSPNADLGPVIRPDDTIIFCPTGPLYMLPLHAIPIDNVPIIETHPVVYCPNLTALRHCFRKAQVVAGPAETKHNNTKLVMNTLPSHWPRSNLDAAPEPVVSINASKHVSERLDATFLQGDKHTKDAIKSSLPGASLFHYHGHVKYVPRAAMQSYLVLDGQGPTALRDSRESSRLTAEDLFDCPLAKGAALATVIGCRSGGADISAADDVLGLPMALFYAGATAVVSSLWKLRDEDGAKWAEEFYGDLIGAQHNGGSEGLKDLAEDEDGAECERTETTRDLVNLAKAMQTAVRKLRFDDDGTERAPYHWAGYTLSGYWMLPRGIVVP